MKKVKDVSKEDKANKGLENYIGYEFVFNDGTIIGLDSIRQAKVILLLFGGIWCPPCRGFQPTLLNFYQEINKGCLQPKKNVEIIFVTCDNSEEEFLEHFQEMPWPAIPYDDPRVAKLEDELEVDAIPILPILRKDGTIAKDNVRSLIANKGVGCFDELFSLSK